MGYVRIGKEEEMETRFKKLPSGYFSGSRDFGVVLHWY